jgi:drug/metabolite transporter (DMT)-like permease
LNEPGPSSTGEDHGRFYWVVFGVTFIWALNYIVAKVALREIPAILAAGMRTLLAGLVMSPLFIWDSRRKGASWTRAELIRLGLLGTVGVGCNQFFFLLGIANTSVSHAALVIGLMPLLVLVIAVLTGRERITAGKVAGISVALGGIAVLQRASAQGKGPTMYGDFLVFISALAFAFFIVFGKEPSRRHGSIALTTVSYLAGGLMLSPLTIWHASHFNFGAVSSTAWWSFLYMTLISSVAGYLFYSFALPHLPSSRVSAFSFLQPLIAALLAVPLLGEPITATTVGGGSLVLAGVFLTERG